MLQTVPVGQMQRSSSGSRWLTMVGLKSADEDRVSLMRSLAASERQIFWMLRLPNALPFVEGRKSVYLGVNFNWNDTYKANKFH